MPQEEEEAKNEEVLRCEMVIQLPRILDEPLLRDDGVVLSEGDLVIHPTIGKGEIIRLVYFDDLGPCVYVMFESGEDEILGASFVQKLDKT